MKIVGDEVQIARRRKSGGGMGVLAILISLVFIVGPFAVPIKLPAMSQVILVGFGVFLLLIGSIVVTITRLYHKTAADEAFVRTGMGGQKAIIDGGAIVIPVVHELIRVSLQTMKLTVTRAGESALITGDNLRADVTAEFFIKVQKNTEDVLSAATSLGEKAINPRQVEETVSEKLVNALRTVAATKQLAELHTKRDDFAQAVQAIVEKDLKHNGLTLESVTISKLDQTPTKDLRPEDNVFDAQGARRIAEITNTAKVERNKIEAEAAQTVQRQNVERDKFLYEQDVARATAAADKDRTIKVAQARAEQEAATVSADQARLAGLAGVERDKAIQVAEVEKAQAIEVANQGREQAAQTAEIVKTKAVELAERDKQIAVTEAECRRAQAHAQQLAAEAEAERKRQEVQTVTVKATAEREKEKTIINAQAKIEQDRLTANLTADVQAYSKRTLAAAERESAEAEAAARLTRAEADKNAKTMESQGDQAVLMVPVEVERKRVEVAREDLKNRAEFQDIAKELQIKLAEIEAVKEVRIKTAEAIGTAFAHAKLTLWGTPEQATAMASKFLTGQGMTAFVDGLMAGPTGNGDNSIATAVKLVGGLVKEKLGVDIESILSKALESPPEETASRR